MLDAAIAYPVKAPNWILSYQGMNITADISGMVLSIRYVDELGGRSGELDIELEDRERRWQGGWFPQQGDRATLMLGYAGEPLLPCGDFQVDELTLEGPPDVFHLRCLPAWITPSLRTRNSFAYENHTPLQVGAAVAARHGMRLVGTANAQEPAYQRITQHMETDLHFLRRLAIEHNYDFTVRGTQLIFYSRSALESQTPVLALSREDVHSFRFAARTYRTYREAQAAYFDSGSKQLHAQAVSAGPAVASGDVLKLVTRCENGQQALERAASALHEANRLLTTAQIAAPGTPLMVAGNVVTLSGWKIMDGNYIVERAAHCLSRDSGYISEADLRKIA